MDSGRVDVRLRRAAQAVDSLPSLPIAVLRVIRLASDPEVPMSELAEAAKADQGLAARMLRSANSAFYGLPRQVSTIYEASALLGLSTVRNLAMFAAACTWFSTTRPQIRGWMNDLLVNSIAAAIAAKLIAEKVFKRYMDDAFCAGLLQNIGAAAMILWRDSKYESVIKEAQESKVPVFKAEMRQYGFDHTLLGGVLGEQWNLPGELLEAIQFHHSWEKAVLNPELTKIIFFSDYVCRRAGLCPNWDAYCDTSSDLAKFGLTESLYAEIEPELRSHFEESKAIATAA